MAEFKKTEIGKHEGLGDKTIRRSCRNKNRKNRIFRMQREKGKYPFFDRSGVVKKSKKYFWIHKRFAKNHLLT